MKTTKKPLAKAQKGKTVKKTKSSEYNIQKGAWSFDKDGKTKPIKKMAEGGTTKKMSYGGVKPKALKKAELGMSSTGMTSADSECSGWPPGKKCHGFNRKAVPGSVRRAQRRPRRF